MTVRDAIEKYADEADKPVLQWLLDRYHMQSEWNVVATVEHVKDPNAKWGSHMKWSPSSTGRAVYDSSQAATPLQLDDALEEIHVTEVDAYINDVNDGKLAGLLGWYVVADDHGSLAYLPTERAALRFRLAEINRRLNP